MSALSPHKHQFGKWPIRQQKCTLSVFSPNAPSQHTRSDVIIPPCECLCGMRLCWGLCREGYRVGTSHPTCQVELYAQHPRTLSGSRVLACVTSASSLCRPAVCGAPKLTIIIQYVELCRGCVTLIHLTRGKKQIDVHSSYTSSCLFFSSTVDACALLPPLKLPLQTSIIPDHESLTPWVNWY